MEGDLTLTIALLIVFVGKSSEHVVIPLTEESNPYLDITFLSEQTRKIPGIVPNIEVKLDCEAQRESARTKSANNFLPSCQKQNSTLYNKVQCHDGSRVCWCVDELSGEPFPDTAVNGRKPDCDRVRLDLTKKKKPPGKHVFKKCKGRRRAKFYARVLNSLKTEMIMAGGSGNVTGERVLHWKFEALDLNKNKNIERREWKPYKEQLKSWRQVKTCARNFFRYCDTNENRRISADEWRECTEQVLSIGDPRHTNPFLHILKPDL
ncbi:unnamed protein product, partial [Mesorhabditis belari]|uniref:Thyroglobulin type-1 domain-containing protein n=1 Tax=Mesorhabditis belari TaxID=2138241 RepID=A0AAF3FUF0_9BILA